jgi:tetratricopeptide (TPR) repeat protein
MRFPAPAAAPGVYGLRARIESWEGELITATLPVLVIDARPQDRALLWTDLKALSGRTGPVAPDETTAGRATEPAQPRRAPKRQASRRIAARYRQALAAAASAARPTALLEFETATLSASGDEPLLQLRAAELLAASNLGRVRVDLLLPVISLHDELFHLYGRRRLVSLVAHTRHLLEELAELYAELGGKPETAAAVLASVGGYMQQMRAFGDSRQLFELALAHKADNAPALLGLAASSEKYGKYLEAVQRLEQLVAARPDLDEARLRLAINLERIGDRQRFRDLLGDIVNGPGTGWVSSIACQELARSLLEAGALDEAAALLEGALERMPDRQALWILMAHVRDRQGQLAQSWESLRRVATAPAGDDRSDRLTYDDWANGPLDEARAALRDGAAALRTALDAELGGGGAAGP